ncbi:hypothetical protein FANTH_4528 [Fusarium anthophilum]|uniref:Fungal N-terminal domain-containing protein n=1 Tax=Fusarium anthophilum TaxID=48485 RepID=A0A8H5E874_9HYPO|nr:hypothetical protein FANTH_4528 [Fusarium anthophilum]
MAELALAIIPLGITVTSGLVKYLKAFSDHDDDRSRLVRQAERFASTFQSLGAVLKRPRLNPELSVSVSEASGCLRECQKTLEELDILQQKIFATTTSAVSTIPPARTKGKFKDGCKKLMYPLRKCDIETLEGALNKLSTTLTIALGMLHLDEGSLTRKMLGEQMVKIQKNAVVNSNTLAVIEELRQPISKIDTALPVLQTSVDSIVPHFDQRLDLISSQQLQIQAQIKSFFDMASARNRDNLETNQQFSYSQSEEQAKSLAAREVEQELGTLVDRAEPVFMCSCYLRRVHYWLKTLQSANSPFMRLTCQGLINFLVAAGASITFRNNHGDLALHGVIGGTFAPASIYGQLNPREDIADRSKYRYPYQRNRRALLDYYVDNQSVANIHYGPLGLAVIRNNLLEVERLVAIHPHTLDEVSHYGETPLHIAIYRLDILKILAKKANSEVWIQYSKEGATILNLAIQVSHEICNPKEDLDESCCPCTLPLRIILAAGCPIIPHRDFRCHSFDASEWFLFTASSHCKTLLAKELRSRRRHLRDLARNRISITEFSIFTALEEVPDIDAIEMDRLLRHKGILGLGPLSTFADEDLHSQPFQEFGYYSRSIFFDLKGPEEADLFMDCGFKIICNDEEYDSSLDRALLSTGNRYFQGGNRHISLDYAMWLFEHQAPLWKWCYRFTGPMPSIFVIADILGMQPYKVPMQDKTSDRAERYLFESTLVDNCSCLCSPEGCNPFTSRMKWLAHPHENTEGLTPQDYAMRFCSHVEIYGRSMSLSHHIIMVQQATFSALKLRHTCLDRPGYSHRPSHKSPMCFLDPMIELEPDEKEFETLNVDVEAMNQLDEVIAMFQEFVLTGRQTTISSKSDDSNTDYSAFNDPSALGIENLYYQRLLNFWEHIWVDRMQVALDTVAKGWENKLHGQDDIVQISTCEEAVQETTDSIWGDDDDETFNRIIQRIQDI